ncbi:metallophosphoesterase [Sesbania bispinosa]|nr:metallophosphoesterase [Sesbania bispinosa]
MPSTPDEVIRDPSDMFHAIHSRRGHQRPIRYVPRYPFQTSSPETHPRYTPMLVPDVVFKGHTLNLEPDNPRYPRCAPQSRYSSLSLSSDSNHHEYLARTHQTTPLISATIIWCHLWETL